MNDFSNAFQAGQNSKAQQIAQAKTNADAAQAHKDKVFENACKWLADNVAPTVAEAATDVAPNKVMIEVEKIRGSNSPTAKLRFVFAGKTDRKLTFIILEEEIGIYRDDNKREIFGSIKDKDALDVRNLLIDIITEIGNS